MSHEPENPFDEARNLLIEELHRDLAAAREQLHYAKKTLAACREVLKREGYKMDSLGLDFERLLGPEVKP